MKSFELKSTVDYKEIGRRIKAARERANLSQDEFGKQLGGYSPTAISLYEQGERKISLETLATVAKVLKITLQELVEGYTEETPSIKMALRADKDLQNNAEIQNQIVDYIEFLKQRKSEK